MLHDKHISSLSPCAIYFDTKAAVHRKSTSKENPKMLLSSLNCFKLLSYSHKAYHFFRHFVGIYSENLLYPFYAAGTEKNIVISPDILV